MKEELFTFLNECPTSFNVVDKLEKEFKKAGFIQLKPSDLYDLKLNESYYLKRNNSTILAFKLNNKINDKFKIVASHTDCPGFKLKPNALIKAGPYFKLNVEVYGGPILSTWLDRPLSLAGRLIVEEDGFKTIPFNLKENFAMIPSLAIHMNKEANNGYKFNPQIDMLPLISVGDDFDLYNFLSEKLNQKVIAYDLFLYPTEKATVVNDYFMANHIDNLESVYLSYRAFMDTNSDDINVFVAFDNEEVGSATKQGADSDFLDLSLRSIAQSLNLNYQKSLANSFLVSLDNAHALHPNHFNKADDTNRPIMNEGIVIKYNANEAYTSDALSMAIFKSILNKANIKYQFFTNRSDIRGGSTLGNISNTKVSMNAIDIGLAQLAMHSCVETAGLKDIEYMYQALKAFYQAQFNLI